MIVTCPSCGTQYDVPDSAIPPEGRQVRCAACGTAWNTGGAGAPEIPASIEPQGSVPDAPSEDEGGEDAFAATPPFVSRRRPWRWIAAILLVALLIAGVAAGGFYLFGGDMRDRLLGGQSAPSPLVIELLREPERRAMTSGNELFVMGGRIRNPTLTALPVPDIQAELRDRRGKAVYSWRISAPVATLPAGRAVEFNSAEIDVPRGADAINLRFVDRAL
ncbi:zinc-ribbon domain-containing protein [Sphingomonas sp. ID0503]|uniref:zinc-ribbon domain-containing protein n=1 Tax=Sphingomonas sp. ID0503 TaxID=3399691 RepID=UPI003AFB1071